MSRLTIVCVLVGAGLARIASAQPPPGQPVPAIQPPQPPPPSPAPTRPRPVQAMLLTTTAWSDGGAIPTPHTQAGRDVSPPLAWSVVPEGTASFVLIARDLDEIVPATGDARLHWLVWNIPSAATALPAGVPDGNVVDPPRAQGAPPRQPERFRQISATGPAYRGPAAPASGPPHHYLFEIFALDTWLDIPAVGQSPAATHTAVVAAMAGHVRGKGTLVGTYRRPSP